MPYSGKLSREKTFASWWKYEKFRRLLAFVGCHAPNFAEKTFTYSHKTDFVPFLSCLVEPCIANNLIFTAIESGQLHATQVPQWCCTIWSYDCKNLICILPRAFETWGGWVPEIWRRKTAKVSYHVTLSSCPLMTPATREAWTCFLSQSKNSDHLVPTWNYFNTLPPRFFFWDESKTSNLEMF